MRFIIPLFFFFVLNTYGQTEDSYRILLEKGIRQAAEISELYKHGSGHDIQEHWGVAVASFCNLDTTRIIMITEKASTYDATNNIREDEHNKVNFITADAFEEPNTNKHILRTILAIYYPVMDTSKQWFVEVTDSTIFFTETGAKTLTKYMSGQVQTFFIDSEKNELLSVFWESGRFAPSPDLRQHPDWEGYGKHVWKNREKKWRPFIGMPILVRDFFLKNIGKRGY
jgi:hypothetical protein